MKKTLLFFVVTFISLGVYAQKKDTTTVVKHYPFVKFHNPDADVKMKEGRYMTVHLYTDSGSSFTYTGNIYVGDKNSLLMTGGTVEYNGITDGGLTEEHRITTNPPDEVTVIPHKEIEYVSMIPKARKVFGTIVVISLVPIFVFVPLALVGYNTGGFDPTAIVEGSAGTLIVSTVLWRAFHIRKFRIKGQPVKY